MIEFPAAAIATWGAVVVFGNVLLTRLGAPLPAIPVLVFAGSAIGNGTLSFTHILFAAVAAALLGDCIWFAAGRRFGRRLIDTLARLSLTVATGVRHARSLFERFGLPIVGVCKFVPGLALATPPLMGATSVAATAYFAWDTAGTLAWAAFWLLGGAAFEQHVSKFMAIVRSHGATIFDVIAAAAVLYLAYRYWQRLNFRRRIAHMKVSPEQLDAMMHSQSPPIVVDARPEAVRDQDPWLIPGALLLDLNSAAPLRSKVMGRSIVVYCFCENNSSSRKMCEQLHKDGFSHTLSLTGGLDAWRRLGYPVKPMPPRVEMFPAALVGT
ncbi:VTT domain-containing protein [Paraburkholderia sp. GAS334]|uniref:VTT domain-containing protein n=1 Tax=Paraburkholderia sp. GAS334 TaxID=3035131 RepID=UPI003D22C2CE